MKIKRVEVKNYRCYEKIEIDFDDKLTVIVGNNGAGKTSILDALTVAMGTVFAKMYTPAGKNIDKSDARLKAYAIGKRDVQPQYPVEIVAEGVVNDQLVRWKRSLNSKKGRTTSVDAKQLTDISNEYQKRIQDGDENLILPIISYYGTGRLWDYHRAKKSDIFQDDNRTNGYIDCLDGTANVKLMLDWFRKETYEKYEDQELSVSGAPTLSVVYGIIEDCYRSITGEDDIRVQYRISENELYVYYKDQEDRPMNMPFSQLSDGYKNTISMVADIAYRMYTLNPQLAENAIRLTPGVVLIDEVDLHLHPQWQHRILEDLRRIFPSVQFIVTTHAPIVINSVHSKNLVILEDLDAREPDGETYGKDANTILNGVMNTEERPNAIKRKFELYYKLLATGDFGKAKKCLDELENDIGSDDSDLSALKLKLKLKMMGI